jgi:hypothetical protein
VPTATPYWITRVSSQASLIKGLLARADAVGVGTLQARNGEHIHMPSSRLVPALLVTAMFALALTRPSPVDANVSLTGTLAKLHLDANARYDRSLQSFVVDTGKKLVPAAVPQHWALGTKVLMRGIWVDTDRGRYFVPTRSQAGS